MTTMRTMCCSRVRSRRRWLRLWQNRRWLLRPRSRRRCSMTRRTPHPRPHLHRRLLSPLLWLHPHRSRPLQPLLPLLSLRPARCSLTRTTRRTTASLPPSLQPSRRRPLPRSRSPPPSSPTRTTAPTAGHCSKPSPPLRSLRLQRLHLRSRLPPPHQRSRRREWRLPRE